MPPTDVEDNDWGSFRVTVNIPGRKQSATIRAEWMSKAEQSD